MININKAIVAGRLTKDIDLRKTQSSLSVCQFTLAVDRPKKKDQEQETDFIQCVAWTYSADFLAKYAKKGDMVAVIGRIQTRSYDDRNAKKVYVTEVVAEDVSLLSTTSKNELPKKASNDWPDKVEVFSMSKSEEDELNKGNNVVIDQEALPFY